MKQQNNHPQTPRRRPSMTPQQKALRASLKDVTNLDARCLLSRIRCLNALKNETLNDEIHAIENDIALAKQKVEQRCNAVPVITFPENLPVSERRAEIERLLKQHQVLVVAGETGSGKTTQLPKMCLELGFGAKGFIGHTQPRRLAARAVATRIAEEIGTELGDLVGYKVRFKDHIQENTQVKLMTDGILLAEIQSDPFLNQYEVLIIDEAHERSLNNDFILGYLKNLLKKRPDLKLIITSATIDVERFSKHFDNAPIVEVSGRTYPVEVRYRPLNETDKDRDQLQGILEAVIELQKLPRGDILVFLSGEREIRDTAEMLEKACTQGEIRRAEILPLYARLSSAEQNKIFHPGNVPRIVLATNVAETSLTVPGIKYVIDPGTARISRYSYRTKVQRLPIEAISQASANQRKGRCGRVSEGVCIRLYSEDDFQNRPKYSDPEILRTNLASVILQMKALGLDDIEGFPFVDKPEARHIQDGLRLLEELGALRAGKNGSRQLTETGRQLARLPVDPRLGKMLLTAAEKGCLWEVMVIVSAISIQDPRERPQEKQQAADEMHRRFADKQSDFLAWINLWQYWQSQQKALTRNQLRRLCKKEFLNYLRLREWQDIYQQIRVTVREMGLPINSEPAPYVPVHTALLSGLLSHIGMKKTEEKNSYLGARNSQFSIFPNSSLFKKPPRYCMAAELVETTKLWGRMVAMIEPEWVEPLAGDLLKRSYAEPHWSKSRGAVMATETVKLYGVPIVTARQVNFGKIDPVLSREIFIRHALVEGDWQTNHAFFKHNTALREEVEALEHKTRRRDILVDDDTLFAFYDKRVPEQIVSKAHFDHWWKNAQRSQPDLLNFDKAFLQRDETQVSELDFPNYWYQGELKLKLTYQFEPGKDRDGVTVHVPLPLLNQLQMHGFDWQIPALRKELVIALIKSLPKSLRRNFVPAPNYADAFLARATVGEKPLLESLSHELRRMTGVLVEPEEWQNAELPSHLQMTFRVEDEQGKTLAESSDLEALKVQLKSAVQESLSAVADDDIERRNIQRWNFATLPQCYEQKKGRFTIRAYPALVDEKDSVAIKLFENADKQQQAMQQGLRRLLLLNVPSPIKYLHEKLPNKAKLGLYFTPFGKVLDLIDDCISCAVDKLIEDFGGVVWDEEKFLALRDFIRANLNETVVAIAQEVEQILSLSYAIQKRLKGKLDFTLAFAFSDIKQQLSGLIYPNFVTETGFKRLKDIQRYLQAIDKRLDKLALDVNKDRAAQLKVENAEKAYKTLLAKLPASQAIPADVLDIRYMLEELRVSLFAQQLGTLYPISDKRILNRIAEVG